MQNYNSENDSENDIIMGGAIPNWDITHESGHKNIFNKFDEEFPELNAQRATFAIEYQQPLFDFISNLELAPATIEKMMFNVSRRLEILGDNGYVMFRDEGTRLRQEKMDLENENELDERELLNYREHWMLEDILQNFGQDHGNALFTDYKLNQQMLILAMIILQPPLRSDFYQTATFIDRIAQNDGIHNFVLVTENEIMYIVNKDKVTNKGKTYKQKKYTFIQVKNPQLMGIIRHSYRTFPRRRVFQSNLAKDIKISNGTFLKRLRDIPGMSPEFSINIARSSYITWYYDNNKSKKARILLSYMNRNSYDTATSNYYKILHSNNAVPIPPEMEIRHLRNQNNILKDKAQEIDDNRLAERMARLNISKQNKKRSDTVYNANSRGTNPSKTTIEKYNLVRVNGVWE